MVVEENGESLMDPSIPKVDSILDRRKQLKRQRRNRFLQSAWRVGATLGIAVALGWGLSQPEWKIRSLKQIHILGNTQLSTQTLERLLPVSYPLSLMRVQPQKIAYQLQNYAHVERVTVSRQLFPPEVNIVIQERSPVAKTRCEGCVLTYDGQAPFAKSDWWLIDSEGVVLPVASYPQLQKDQSLPALEIDGYLSAVKSEEADPKADGKPMTVASSKRKQLQAMLPLILGSPTPIQRVDWRDPKNLKLATPLGTAHLANSGADSAKLKAQLVALDQLRSLSQQVDLNTIEYLDLSDPKHPTLEVKPKVDPKPSSQVP